MRVRHPLTLTRPTVELTEAVTRGGVRYAAGHQFAAVTFTARAVYALTADGTRVVLPADKLKAVGRGPLPRPKPDLAAMRKAGLLKSGAELAAE